MALVSESIVISPPEEASLGRGEGWGDEEWGGEGGPYISPYIREDHNFAAGGGEQGGRGGKGGGWMMGLPNQRTRGRTGQTNWSNRLVS